MVPLVEGRGRAGGNVEALIRESCTPTLLIVNTYSFIWVSESQPNVVFGCGIRGLDGKAIDVEYRWFRPHYDDGDSYSDDEEHD